MKRHTTLALVILCTLLPIAAQFAGDRASGWLGVDFRSYYCAALAQREGLNPYFAQSVHACEASTPQPFYRPPSNVTVPAPYPPYALAMLYPMTFVPFVAAAIMWWLLLALAVLLAAHALARVARQPWPIAWAALALSAGLTALGAGNVMPLGLCALLLAALAATNNRPLLAALAAAVALIEPHVALPAELALFIGFPAIRVPLAAGGAALAALSLATGGVALNVAYLTTVVPAHALAEVSRDNQYSLSSVVAAFGVPDAAAASLGTISYIVMTGIGVFAALRLARRFAEPAMLALVPPAVALLGGSFVHTVELAAAVPAALLLYERAQEHRAWLFAALLLLAVPWMMATSLALLLAPLVPVAYLTHELWRRDGKAAFSAALASSAILVVLFVLAAIPAHHVAHPHFYPPINPRLAEASWRAFVLGNTTNRPAMWLLRLPTWIGLVALLYPALMLARPAVRSAAKAVNVVERLAQ
jgi:hypothetical protein